MVSLSSFHGSRLPASAPGIWRPRLPTRDKETQQCKSAPDGLFVWFSSRALESSAQFSHIDLSSSSLFSLGVDK